MSQQIHGEILQWLNGLILKCYNSNWLIVVWWNQKKGFNWMHHNSNWNLSFGFTIPLLISLNCNISILNHLAIAKFHHVFVVTFNHENLYLLLNSLGPFHHQPFFRFTKSGVSFPDAFRKTHQGIRPSEIREIKPRQT